MFLRSRDAYDQVKDPNLLFRLLDEVVEEVGASNVVQIITDNASNYVLNVVQIITDNASRL